MQMKGEEMPTGVYVMRDIIVKMIHSGKYSPGPDWLTPQIGKGLNLDNVHVFSLKDAHQTRTHHKVGRRLSVFR